MQYRVLFDSRTTTITGPPRFWETLQKHSVLSSLAKSIACRGWKVFAILFRH
jgi:hypothetical protein